MWNIRIMSEETKTLLKCNKNSNDNNGKNYIKKKNKAFAYKTEEHIVNTPR